MSTSIIARLGLDTAAFERGMKSATSGMQKFRQKMNGFTGMIGVGGLAAMSKRAIDLASTIDDVSKKLDIGAESLQAYQFAGREVGMTNETVNMSLQRFSRRIGEAIQGKGELLPLLEKYNIALKTADGRTRSVEDIMRDYADVVKGAGSQNERLALMMKAVDSEGVGLVTVFQDGAAGLDELTNKAREAGQVMSDDMVAGLAKAENQLERFERRTTLFAGFILKKFMDLGEGIGTALGEMVFRDKDFEYWRDQAINELKDAGKVGRFGLTFEQITQVNDRARELQKAEEARIDEIKKNLDEKSKKEQEAHDTAIAALDLEIENQDAIKDQQSELKQKISETSRALAETIRAAKAQLTSKDPGKMSLSELASVGKFQTGVSIDTALAGEQAREYMRLTKLADQQRRMGNMSDPFGTGFEGYTSKANSVLEGLFKGGKVRFSELPEALANKMIDEQAGSKDDILKSQLEASNKHLSEIEKAVKAERAYK